jgi:hypothetical protein
MAISLHGEGSISSANLHAPHYDVTSITFTFVAHISNSRFLTKQHHLVGGA